MNKSTKYEAANKRKYLMTTSKIMRFSNAGTADVTEDRFTIEGMPVTAPISIMGRSTAKPASMKEKKRRA